MAEAHRMLVETIHETPDGRYYYAAAYDGLPTHKTCAHRHPTIEDAQVYHPVAWQEPDEECSGDVVAVAYSRA